MQKTCRVCAEVVARAERWLTECRELWEERFDRLGALLERQAPATTRVKAAKHMGVDMSAGETAYFHRSFTLTCSWSTTPARVFAAWADPGIKARWFSGLAEGWSLIRRELGFRCGGVEILEGRIHASGTRTLCESRFHLIAPNRRLIYDHDLRHDDSFHSVGLSSLLVEPDGACTRISYTEQIVFLDGRDGTAGQKHGTGIHWAALEAVLLTEEVS